MRASGVTTARFCVWLGIAGLLLAVLMFVLGEFIAPPLQKYAMQLKVFSKFSEFSFAGDRGTWARDGDTIVSVEQQSASTRYGGVLLFQFDPQRRLLSIGRAESASLDADEPLAARELRGDALRRKRHRGRAQPGQGGALVAVGRLPRARGGRARTRWRCSDIVAYVRHLRANDLDTRGFETAFWSRIARMAALLLVVMLALPFALGPVRSSGQGARIVIGILIGAGYVLHEPHYREQRSSSSTCRRGWSAGSRPSRWPCSPV